VNFRGLHYQIREVGPGSPVASADAYSASAKLFSSHSGKLRTPAITLQSGTTGIATTFVTAMAAQDGVGGVEIEVSDVRIMKL
jgi:hypothetical protein